MFDWWHSLYPVIQNRGLEKQQTLCFSCLHASSLGNSIQICLWETPLDHSVPRSDAWLRAGSVLSRSLTRWWESLQDLNLSKVKTLYLQKQQSENLILTMVPLKDFTLGFSWFLFSVSRDWSSSTIHFLPIKCSLVLGRAGFCSM